MNPLPCTPAEDPQPSHHYCESFEGPKLAPPGIAISSLKGRSHRTGMLLPWQAWHWVTSSLLRHKRNTCSLKKEKSASVPGWMEPEQKQRSGKIWWGTSEVPEA